MRTHCQEIEAIAATIPSWWVSIVSKYQTYGSVNYICFDIILYFINVLDIITCSYWRSSIKPSKPSLTKRHPHSCVSASVMIFFDWRVSSKQDIATTQYLHRLCMIIRNHKLNTSDSTCAQCQKVSFRVQIRTLVCKTEERNKRNTSEPS